MEWNPYLRPLIKITRLEIKFPNHENALISISFLLNKKTTGESIILRYFITLPWPYFLFFWSKHKYHHRKLTYNSTMIIFKINLSVFFASSKNTFDSSLSIYFANSECLLMRRLRNLLNAMNSSSSHSFLLLIYYINNIHCEYDDKMKSDMYFLKNVQLLTNYNYRTNIAVYSG